MSYKEIPLTNSDRKVRVSPEDYDELIKYKWRLSSNGYVRRSVYNNRKKSTVTMHREIMGALKNQIVDHIDSNRINNTRVNLRITDKFGNARNKKKNKTNVLYKGVKEYRGKSGEVKFIATIRCNGSNLSLGDYSTKEDAARAYNIAAKTLFNDYASFNEVPDKFKTPIRTGLVRGATSKYFGVHYNKSRNRYVAVISFNKKKIAMVFKTEIEAARAYNKKAIELYGDKARLNTL